jgi:cyclopropane fatty-acyl-phospholipid synthase-like methyltransferase
MPRARQRAERARGGAAAPNDGRASQPWDGWLDDTAMREPTALHALRLQAVHEALRASGARSVADLGCGDGALVRQLLADPAIGRVVAIDRSLSALGRLERTVDAAHLFGGRLVLVQGSFTAGHRALAGVDAVVMVETIEHVAPALLSAVEQHVFAGLHAATVIVTTPNQEYNEIFGMAPGQMREPGHHFEWTRQRFRAWAGGVAQRQGYVLAICGIGAADLHRGCPTQMATFTRAGGRCGGQA